MYFLAFWLITMYANVVTTGSAARSFALAHHGGLSLDSSAAIGQTLGYARIQADERRDGIVLPSGMVLFSHRRNGMLVSETSVAAAPLTSSGRVFAEVDGVVNTGIAIANPNSQPVTINFYFTDSQGNRFGDGVTTIPANQQIAAFLNEAPFDASAPIKGTFTFESSLLISAVALRGFTNERDDFLMSTLPVSPRGAGSPNPLTIPHFAQGAGWQTDVVLVNPTAAAMSGQLQVYGQSGEPIAITFDGAANDVFDYSIPANGALKLEGARGTPELKAGFISVEPGAGAVSPQAFATFRYVVAGVTVTESSIAALPAAQALTMFVESDGEFGKPGSLQSGIAIANMTQFGEGLIFSLYALDGSLIGTTEMTLQSRSQRSLFLNEIPGLPALPSPFQGTLRVFVPGNRFYQGAVSLAVLRARYNERGDFLITTTPPIREVFSTTSSELLFPHFTIGAEYETQFVIFGDRQTSGTVYFFDTHGNPLPLQLQ